MLICDNKDDKLTFSFFFTERLNILADKWGGCLLNQGLSGYNTEGLFVDHG